jgi:hypothetical protein
MNLYEVISVDREASVRLVEAKTKAGARAFAAQDSLKVERCSASRAHTLAARGIKIENAEEEANERTE